MLTLKQGRVQAGEGGFEARTSARAERWGGDLAVTVLIREAHPGDTNNQRTIQRKQPTP